jgi:hypothetical protein
MKDDCLAAQLRAAAREHARVWHGQSEARAAHDASAARAAREALERKATRLAKAEARRAERERERVVREARKLAKRDERRAVALARAEAERAAALAAVLGVLPPTVLEELLESAMVFGAAWGVVDRSEIVPGRWARIPYDPRYDEQNAQEIVQSIFVDAAWHAERLYGLGIGTGFRSERLYERKGEWLLVRVPTLAQPPWRTMMRVAVASAVASVVAFVVADGAWRVASVCGYDLPPPGDAALRTPPHADK